MIESLFGENGVTPAGIAVIAAAVVVVLLLLYLIFRRRGPMTFLRGSGNRQPRLAVLDAAPVDSRRRLVLVRRDNVEHLIMIGGPTDIVIESRIVRADGARVPKKPAAQGRPAQAEERKPAPAPIPEPVPAPPPPAPAPEAAEMSARQATAANDQRPVPVRPQAPEQSQAPEQKSVPVPPVRAAEPVAAPKPASQIKQRAPVVTPTMMKPADKDPVADSRLPKQEPQIETPEPEVPEPETGDSKPAPAGSAAVDASPAPQARKDIPEPADDKPAMKSEEAAAAEVAEKPETAAATQVKQPEEDTALPEQEQPSKARELIGEFDEMLESELDKDPRAIVEAEPAATGGRNQQKSGVTLEDEMKKLLGDLSVKR